GLVGEVPVDDRLRRAHRGGELVHGQVRTAVVHGAAGLPAQLSAAFGAVCLPAAGAAVHIGFGAAVRRGEIALAACGGDPVHVLRVSGTLGPRHIVKTDGGRPIVAPTPQ